MAALINDGEYVCVCIVWMAEWAVPAVFEKLGAVTVDLLYSF